MIPILKDAAESDTANLQNEILISSLLKTEKEEFAEIIDQLKSSLGIISSYDPFIAMELKVALNQNLYFNEYEPIDDSFKLKEHIEIQLKTCAMFSKYLKRIIKKLLRQTDKVFLIKFLYRDYKEKKSNSPFDGVFNK